MILLISNDSGKHQIIMIIRIICGSSDNCKIILMISKWFWWSANDSDDQQIILMITKWFWWSANDSDDHITWWQGEGMPQSCTQGPCRTEEPVYRWIVVNFNKRFRSDIISNLKRYQHQHWYHYCYHTNNIHKNIRKGLQASNLSYASSKLCPATDSLTQRGKE